MREKVTVQHSEVSQQTCHCERFLRSNLSKTALSLTLLAVTRLLPGVELLREKLFTLLAFGVLFISITNKVLAWEEVTLPSQTTIVNEDELFLNGHARKYLHCRN